MPINASGAVGAPLTVYGSWVTDVSPDALPENVSPDNQEVVYAPGAVSSRPAFQKILGITFPQVNGIIPNPVYGKSFITPTGIIKNLYFDSAGRLWVEDLTNNPGVLVLLAQSTPGSYCRSITKFGREYIAISDGLHGAEAPLQYDGTNLDRVTMDGPGGAPIIASVPLPAAQMISSGNTLVRNNNQVLASTATPHGLKVGYQVQIANIPDSNSTTVNQSNNSSAQSSTGSWSLVSGQWRSNFNPGTSPLSAFVASGFGFNVPSIATILGVVVSFGSNLQAASTATIAQVALWYTGAQEGTAKSPGTPMTTAITINSYGSAADLWGAALTPAIVNDPSFGFAISCTLSSTRAFLDFPFTVQVYYTLSGSSAVAIVSSIVIDNKIHPGLALITTTQPHGLIPAIDVSIVGVQPATVSTITAAQWSAGKTTITTSNNHNLIPGSVVQIGSVGTATGSTTFSFNGNFTIEEVPSPNQIVYAQVPITATDPDVINATANTGSVFVSWPIPDNTPNPTYFGVDSCPTQTTFYVAVNYADGTWTTGTVGFIWEGTFYVTQVVDATHFYYFQPGPNMATSAIGTVTPYGQAAPGLHLCQVLWITRQGAIPAPGPFAKFIANGGQYVSVSNIPIGPPNVIARILAFSGAQPDIPGVLPPMYYIPVPAQLEGQVISTATVINDNTSTTAFLDFSDNTLFAAIGISVPGNNLANQIILDGALGFRTYLSRLLTFGQRNVIQNMLNMGFEGGTYTNPVFPTQLYPLGWNVNLTNALTGTTINAHFGSAWQISLGSSTTQAGNLSQSAYLDIYGDPILIGSQRYSVRFWAQSNGVAFTDMPTMFFVISSASTGFNTSASIAVGNPVIGQYFQGDFDIVLPDNIPSDSTFQFWLGGAGTGYNLIVDDLQVIFSQSPYLEENSFASYPNNPEGFDGITGLWGAQDTAKLMDMGIVRGTLYLLTQAPNGKIHFTNGSATLEPSGWDVEPVEGNCGALSAFTMTASQADDATEAGGDDWIAWASDKGAMIFGGGKPLKISQEIQPNWSDSIRQNTGQQINLVAAKTAWTLNDPVSRLLYFGLPIGSATAPSQIYVLNYQHLGTAESIANSPPFHPSLGGKLIATDNSRKWTHWLRAMNGAARMYRSVGQLTSCFFSGNGQTVGSVSGFGNAYILNPEKFTDDDYGRIFPYYVTYFFLDPEKRLALQLKGGRLLLAYVLAQIQPQSGDTNSQVQFTYFGDSLNNPWPIQTTRVLTVPFWKDRNFGGGMVQGERIAIKIASSPVSGTDNSFVLTRLESFFRNARILISGVNS